MLNGRALFRGAAVFYATICCASADETGIAGLI
jgi:hypothetical protein